jgi:hypothetical protein
MASGASAQAQPSSSVTPLIPQWAAVATPIAPYSSPSNPATSASTTPTRERDEDTRAAKRRREQWLLSLEAVTHAPVDVGFQLGVETPFRLRLFGAYGWVPRPYMNLLTGVAAGATDNPYAETLLEQAEYSGHTWRVQAGVRPFRALGLYGDVGYARLRADGALDLSSSGVPALARLGGGYEASTKLDMWLIELGYQAQLADRMVLALALGAMGTVNASTSITSVGGAPSDDEALDDAATQADSALESYGIVPTLTLRLGVDLI